MAECSTEPSENFKTFVVQQLKVVKAAAWILNLMQTVVFSVLFCYLHIVGRIPPVQQMELCAAAGASRDAAVPLPAARKC